MQSSDFNNNFNNDFDLFNKMKDTKTTNKNLDTSSDKNDKNDKNDDKKSNNRNKIDKCGFDYYKILGVDKDTFITDIQKKYRKLLAKYHPDKYKNLQDNERKQKESQFQLVQMAGKVLTNEDSKKMYDLEQKTIKSKDFISQKNSFEDFIKMQSSDITDETRIQAHLEFESEAIKINKLRGFDPEKMKDKLDKHYLDKHITDLKAQRDIDEIELTKKNLFDGRQFNPSEFNNIFEKDKKKQDKKLKKKQESGEVVKFGEDFTAFNDNGLDNFISVDKDYSDPFGENNFRENNLYGKIKDNFSVSDISSDEDDNNNYDNHNLDRDSQKTGDKLADLMKQRGLFDNNLKDTKTAGYKDVMEDQFGISRQFGKMIGRDITQNNKPQKLNTDMINIYNKTIGYDSDTSNDE